MSKIPTTEELMLKYIPNGIQNIKGSGDGRPQYNAEKLIIQKCMIEFARLHCEAQEKAIQTGIEATLWQNKEELEIVSERVDYIINHIPIKQSITSAYPLDLIK